MRRLVPLLLAVFAVLAGPAQAAVQQDASGAYIPSNGPELLEALSLLAPDQPGVIKLAEGNYAIDEPISLTAQSKVTLLGAGPGRAIITGPASPPADPTLLRLTGSVSQVSGVSFLGRGASLIPYALVQLRGGAALEHSEVSVLAELPNVTGVELIGSGNHLTDVEVSTDGAAPAARAFGGAEIVDSALYGGSPVLDIDTAPELATAVVGLRRTVVTAAPLTEVVAAVHGGATTTTLQLANDRLQGTSAPGATLLDVAGARSAGARLTAQLASTDLIGGATGTALALTPGAETVPTAVAATGLLALGSGTAVACRTSAGTPATVAISAVYRDGALSPGSSCAITESGRRTGDPLLSDPGGLDFRPLWGSSLIDAAPPTPSAVTDLSGLPRESTGATRPATPVDIGALEYQYSPPVITEATAAPVDNRGLVRLAIAATDQNPDEAGGVTVTWRLPGGAVSHDATLDWRFTADEPTSVTVEATDVSGLTVSRTLTATPLIDRTKPPALLDGTPIDFRDPAPPNQTLPEFVPLPTRPTTPPPPGEPLSEPAPILTALTVVRSRVAGADAGRGRPSGLGAARPTEAAVHAVLTREATIVLSVLRQRGKRFVAIPAARLTLAAASGANTIRLSRRIGKVTLRRGLYRVTMDVRPATGLAIRRVVAIRIT